MTNAYALESALESILGESKEETGYDYYEEYTGLNGFYHLLSGNTGYSANRVEDHEAITKKGNVVTVEGLGDFTFIEQTEENFSTYEKSWDDYLVFEFEGKTFRVQGYLDSHGDGVWDGGLTEVKAVEKTIRVWERV